MGSLITPFHTPLPFLQNKGKVNEDFLFFFFLLYINVRLQSSGLRPISVAPSMLPGDV